MNFVYLHKRSGTIWAVVEIVAGEVTLRNTNNGDEMIVGEDDLKRSFTKIVS